METGTDLNEYITEFLKVAHDKESLRILDASYQDEFKDEGERKSEYIVEDLRHHAKKGISLESIVLLSIGGADGSEVVSILEKTAINKAVMIEYSQEGAEAARIRAKKLSRINPKKEFRVICGDATQQLESALDIIEDWRSEDESLDGLVLSCQAVLHELPRRSPNYNHTRFIGTIFRSNKLKTKGIYIKEPCFPENWNGHEKILMRIPGVDGELLSRFSNHVAKELDIACEAEYLAGNSVYLSPELALETLHKLIRKNSPSRLAYELGEQLTSFVIEEVKSVATSSIGSQCRNRASQTGGFYRALDHYKVEFFTDGERKELNDPQSHVTITGFHSEKPTPEILLEAETKISVNDSSNTRNSIQEKGTWREEDYNFDGYKIEKMPLIEFFDDPLLKADVLTEIEAGKTIPSELEEYYSQNLTKLVDEKLNQGKALTNGKGYSLKRIIIQKDAMTQGGRKIRPHLVFEPAEYFQQLMFSERLDTPNLINNSNTIRDLLQVDFKTFDWPMIEEISIPQRFANVVGLILPISHDNPDDLCMVVAIRSNQALVSANDDKSYYQASMSCAEGMLRPDDAEYGKSDRYPPSPFNTAIRALKEELNVNMGQHFLEKDVEMLSLAYDSNRCQPVAVFKVQTHLLSFEELVTNWLRAKDRNENRDILPLMLNKSEFTQFLNGEIYYDGKPIKMFSNHQLLGACVVGKHYLGTLN